MVFADSGTGLMKEILTSVGDPTLDFRDSGFLLVPILGELLLFGELPLSMSQLAFKLLEAVQRLDERGIGERSEPGNAHVDPNSLTGRMNGLFSFQLSQDRDVPMAAILADGHTLGCTIDNGRG